MLRFMRSGWVGFSSSLRETHENNVVKNFVEWFYFVLLESFTESILQRERERERERGSLNLMGINMALVYKMGGLDTEICEWK